MGCIFEATCRCCGHRFEFRSGGGMIAHYLHCDQCSIGKSVRFDEFKALTVGGPQNPGTDASYDATVESVAGKCSCGGSFKFDAPIRCPRCRSTDVDWDEDNPSVLID